MKKNLSRSKTVLATGVFDLLHYGHLRFLEEAKKAGYDPSKWFNHVEMIAAKRIGRETVQYVSNIYKYYVAYSLIVEKLKLKNELRRSKQDPE